MILSVWRGVSRGIISAVMLIIVFAFSPDTSMKACVEMQVIVEALPNVEGSLLGVILFRPTDDRIQGLKTGLGACALPSSFQALPEGSEQRCLTGSRKFIQLWSATIEVQRWPRQDKQQRTLETKLAACFSSTTLQELKLKQCFWAARRMTDKRNSTI